jgi:hypothetical protein
MQWAEKQMVDWQDYNQKTEGAQGGLTGKGIRYAPVRIKEQ